MQKISVTIPEAVEMTGIGRTSFYECFRRGDLKPRKMKGKTIILVEELSEYVRSLPVADLQR